MNYTLLLLLIVTVATCGCKEDDNDPQTPVSGAIKGQLKLSDEFGNDLSDFGGMKVSTQTGEYGVSNASGIYRIENLPTGDYDLSFEKAGFGTYRRFQIKVVAGSGETTLNGIDVLGAKSTTEISNLFITFNNVDSTFTMGCDINPVPSTSNPRAFRLFFSKEGDVSFQDFLFTPNNTWTSTVGNGVITGYDRGNFYSNGFIPGDSVYVIAYGEAINTNTYILPGTNSKVYPNINVQTPSNIVGILLP